MDGLSLWTQEIDKDGEFIDWAHGDICSFSIPMRSDRWIKNFIRNEIAGYLDSDKIYRFILTHTIFNEEPDDRWGIGDQICYKSITDYWTYAKGRIIKKDINDPEFEWPDYP